MKKFVRKMVIVVLGFSVLAVSGCGNAKTAEQTVESESETGNATDVQKITVGSGTTYHPYCYLNENGEAEGYEYALLQEIDKLLPQYEFEYQSMNFDSLLLALDTGKIDLAAHQYEYTDERAEKYLFSEEAYTTYVTYIAVLTSDDHTNSLKDLKGKKVRTDGITSAATSIVQAYNEENPDDQVEIVSTDSSTDEETVAALKSGAADALILTKRDVEKFNKNYGDGTDFIKTVGEPVNNSKTYYLYRKEETELQEAVDGALKTLKENGKLAELSNEYLGGNFTESE